MYFNRMFATSFRSGAAKYSWGFVPLLDLRGPNFVKSKPEEEKTWKKRSYWTKQNRNIKYLEQKTGGKKSQWRLVSDAQREILLIRCKLVSDVCASCRVVFPRVVMIRLFDYFWRPLGPFSKFFFVYCLLLFYFVCCINCVLNIVIAACYCTSSLAAQHVPELCFWPAKNGRRLKFFKCIHILGLLLLKYCSDINEGIWIQVLFHFIVLVNTVASFTVKSFFCNASVFGLKLPCIALLWNRFQMDSKNELTRNKRFFKFFCQKFLISLVSHLLKMKAAIFAHLLTTAIVVFCERLMEPTTAPVRRWPRWWKKCFSGWRKLKKLELFEKHLCLSLGAQVLLRRKWWNWYTTSLLLRYIGEYNCVVYKHDDFFPFLGQVFGLKFSRIAVSRKPLQLDSKTYLTTNGLLLEFFVGICLVSSFSYLRGLKSARIAQTLFFLRHRIFLIVSLRGILVCSLNLRVLSSQRSL